MRTPTRLFFLLLLVLAWIVTGAPASAEIGQTAAIQGTVTDSAGQALAGVTIQATGPALSGGPASARSDQRGAFRLQGLPPGRYVVTLTLQGFRSVSYEDVSLTPGTTTRLAVTLGAGESQPALVIPYEPPVVDRYTSAIDVHLDRAALDRFPVASRVGHAALVLAPGVADAATAYGSRGSTAHAYLMDGANAGDPRSGANWLQAGYGWVEEVRVSALGAPAEDGGFSGLQSSIVIGSGSNQVRGRVDTLFQSQALAGNNVSESLLKANPDLAPARISYNTDTTAQLGGPLQRDRLWIFTGAQYARLKDTPPGYPPVNPCAPAG